MNKARSADELRAFADDQAELQLQLTSIASERVTWEGARNLALARATEYFSNNHDAMASAFRALAKEFDKLRATASKKQDEILAKLGRPTR